MAGTSEKSVSVGAVWAKTSKKNTPYLSLSVNVTELLKSLGYEAPEGLEKVKLVGFQNGKKSEDKQPDYYVHYFFPETT